MIGFVIGLLIGGLALSAAWGLFWCSIGLVGARRGSCSWRVVAKSLTVGAIPLLLMVGLWWWAWDPGQNRAAFGIGVLGMPAVLMGFGLRRAPDGQRAGAHMMDGVRHLKDELLGQHQGCGGCDHEHDPEGCA